MHGSVLGSQQVAQVLERLSKQVSGVMQVQIILKPTQGVTWTSGKPENEGGYGAVFLE